MRPAARATRHVATRRNHGIAGTSLARSVRHRPERAVHVHTGGSLPLGPWEKSRLESLAVLQLATGQILGIQASTTASSIAIEQSTIAKRRETSANRCRKSLPAGRVAWQVA